MAPRQPQNRYQPVTELAAQLLCLVAFGYLAQKKDDLFQNHPTGHSFDLPRETLLAYKRTGKTIEGRRRTLDMGPPLT